MRRTSVTVATGFLLLLACLLSVPMAGQNPSNDKGQQQAASAQEPPTSSRTIRVTSSLVNVLFTVYDKKNRMVVDLTRDDIQVKENDQPQTVRFFSRESDLPLRIGILIDTSNSVRERLHFEEEAAIDFLSSAVRPGKDLAFVVGFDVEPQLVQDYTDDQEALADAIHKLAAGGGTAMYDCVYFASKEKMLYFPPPEPYLRRVLIVISDGLDNQSERTRDEALAMAQHGEVTIYAISTNRSGISTRGDEVLKYLAKETGGRAFFPFAATDLAENFQEIGRELRSQYSLGYVSSNPAHGGTFRKITIEARNKDFHVHSKVGYFAATQ